MITTLVWPCSLFPDYLYDNCLPGKGVRSGLFCYYVLSGDSFSQLDTFCRNITGRLAWFQSSQEFQAVVNETSNSFEDTERNDYFFTGGWCQKIALNKVYRKFSYTKHQWWLMWHQMWVVVNFFSGYDAPTLQAKWADGSLFNPNDFNNMRLLNSMDLCYSESDPYDMTCCDTSLNEKHQTLCKVPGKNGSLYEMWCKNVLHRLEIIRSCVLFS